MGRFCAPRLHKWLFALYIDATARVAPEKPEAYRPAVLTLLGDRFTRRIMGKQTLRTTKFTVAELAKKEQFIEQILGSLKGCRDAIESLGEDHVYVFAGKSFERGVKQLDSFASELNDAMKALARSDAYTAKTKKSDL